MPHKKIALIQMSCAVNTEDNLHKAAALVREASRAGSNIVCLPELFRAQYFCQREEHALFDVAESIPGPSTDLLSAVAREENVVVIASLFERRAPGLYHNTAAVLESDGSLAGLYRKMHIPTIPSTTRSSTSPPETSASAPSPPPKAKSAPSCAGTSGTPKPHASPRCSEPETLFYPTAIGWHPSEKVEFGDAQYSAWQTMQRAHAIANGVFVAAVNRVGHEYGDVQHNSVLMPGPGTHTPDTGIQFWGGSFIADPFGRVIAQASHDKEEILIAEIDPKLLEDTRRNWPFLRDRRVDAYSGITSRFLD